MPPHLDPLAAVPDVITMVLMADPVSLSVVRERLRKWLGLLRWPGHEIEDIVIAVDEAVSRAVQRAAPAGAGAEVRVAARQFTEADGGRRVIVGVSDDCGPERRRPDRNGGLGLLMVYACMDQVELSEDSEGTTMLMTSVRVPPIQ